MDIPYDLYTNLSAAVKPGIVAVGRFTLTESSTRMYIFTSILT
jgi:hypothetical protein